MPCVTTDPAAVRTLQDLSGAEPSTNFVLDLVSMTIIGAGRTFPVHLAEGRRRQFLEGSWDATAELLKAAPLIDAKIRQLTVVASMTASLNR